MVTALVTFFVAVKDNLEKEEFIWAHSSRGLEPIMAAGGSHSSINSRSRESKLGGTWL